MSDAMSQPSQIVIFGASGDLTRRKLVPALARLSGRAGERPGFSLVGVSRRPKSDEEFRRELRAALPDALRADFDRLAPRGSYQPGDISSPE